MNKQNLIEVQRIDMNKMPRYKKIAVLMVGFGGYFLAAGLLGLITEPPLRARLIVGIPAIFIAIVLHELMHGLAFYRCGGIVKFGLQWSKWAGPIAYTTSPNTIFTKRQMVSVFLAPQVLTLIALGLFFIFIRENALVSYALVMFAAMNFGGGCFDFYGVQTLLCEKREVFIEDTPKETIIYRRA